MDAQLNVLDSGRESQEACWSLFTLFCFLVFLFVFLDVLFLGDSVSKPNLQN